MAFYELIRSRLLVPGAQSLALSALALSTLALPTLVLSTLALTACVGSEQACTEEIVSSNESCAPGCGLRMPRRIQGPSACTRGHEWVTLCMPSDPPGTTEALVCLVDTETGEIFDNVGYVNFGNLPERFRTCETDEESLIVACE